VSDLTNLRGPERRPLRGRRLALGTIAQQGSQAAGLLAMLIVTTVVGRRLSLREFGVFGLLSSLAGYLLVVQNAAAAAAVRELAASLGAGQRERRSVVFASALVLYTGGGLVAALALAICGPAVSFVLGLEGQLARDTQGGALLLATVTAIGWPLTIFRDVLRARGRFVALAVCEVAGIVAYAALVCALALTAAPLWVLIGAAGTLPPAVGLTALAARPLAGGFVARSAARPERATVGSLLAAGAGLSGAEIANAVAYTADRGLLGALGSARLVGLFEGPLRAHNVLRALSAALVTTVLPTAARLHASGDVAGLRELAQRGIRYALLLTAPAAAVVAAGAAVLLEVWLGQRYVAGASGLRLLCSYWLLQGAGAIAGAILVALGRTAVVARTAASALAANVLLALVAIPPLGVAGAALAFAVPAGLQALWLVWRLRQALDLTVRELLSAAVPGWLATALALAAAWAGLAVAGEAAWPALLVLPVALLVGWFVAFVTALKPAERAFARSLLRRLPVSEDTPGTDRRSVSEGAPRPDPR